MSLLTATSNPCPKLITCIFLIKTQTHLIVLPCLSLECAHILLCIHICKMLNPVYWLYCIQFYKEVKTQKQVATISNQPDLHEFYRVRPCLKNRKQINKAWCGVNQTGHVTLDWRVVKELCADNAWIMLQLHVIWCIVGPSSMAANFREVTFIIGCR